MPKRGGMSKLNIKSEEHRLELPDDAAPSFGMDIGNGQILPGLPVGESPPSLGKSSKALEGEVQGHQQATPPRYVFTFRPKVRADHGFPKYLPLESSESVTSDGIANPAGPSAVAESSMSITSSLVDEFRTPSILKNASSVQCPPSYISIPKSGSKTPSSLPTCSTSTLTLFPDDSVSNKGPRQTGRVQDNPKRLSRVSGISQCDSNFSETEAMDVDDTSSVAVTPSHAMSIDDEPQVLPLDLIRNICLSLEIDYSAGMSLDRVREQYVQRLQKFPNTQYTSDVSLDETLRTGNNYPLKVKRAILSVSCKFHPWTFVHQLPPVAFIGIY